MTPAKLIAFGFLCLGSVVFWTSLWWSIAGHVADALAGMLW